MSLLEKTKLILRGYRITPNRLLGQNFMIDPSIFDKLDQCSELRSSDVALDVGAGLGFLSRFLAERCEKVIAVEKDHRLIKALSDQLSDVHNVTIIEGDVLKASIPEFSKVVSIPPYQISSRLILWLAKRRYLSSVLVLQKEFADRLVAPLGTDEYSWLTVMARYYLNMELLEAVPREMFFPQPKIDSIIVRSTLRKQEPFEISDTDMFLKLTRFLFSQRNRKLRNAIMPFMKNLLKTNPEKLDGILESIPFLERRVREMAPTDFGELSNAICEQDGNL